MRDNIVVNLKNLSKSYSNNALFFSKSEKVISDINLKIHHGEIVGLVGRSGCGKSTIAKCMSGILNYDNGSIKLKDKYLHELKPFERNIWLRTYLQYLFQNCIGTFHPKKSIEVIFKESIKSISKVTGKKLKGDFSAVLKKVDLDSNILNKFPSDFSGGELQRISIARALLAEPEILIADEPISSLDVTTQARILNLLNSLKEDFGISILYITHDLSTAHFLCDWVVVMDNGHIIEQNTKNDLFNHPKHKHTKKLIALSR